MSIQPKCRAVGTSTRLMPRVIYPAAKRGEAHLHVEDKPYAPEKDFFAEMRDAEGKVIVYEDQPKPILSLASISGGESEAIEIIEGSLERVCTPDNRGMHITPIQ